MAWMLITYSRPLIARINASFAKRVDAIDSRMSRRILRQCINVAE